MSQVNTPRHVDVAILGAGTAGLGARRAATKEGATAVMIDPGPFGTTCARVGCMPSKLLIAAADAVHHAKQAPMFGVHTGEVRVDGAAVLKRVQSERDRFVGFVNRVIDEAGTDGELIVGRARVAGAGRLLVELNEGGEVEVTYDKLVVATGSTPFVPPPFRGIDPSLSLTNEEVFEMKELPESILVVGLGVIGLELGQALHRLGVRTTLVGIGGQVAHLTDPVVNEEAFRVLSKELDLHPDYTLNSIETVDEGVSFHFVDSRGRERRETFARVLLAAGRTPNLANLGLDNAGVDLKKDAVDPDTLQLGNHPIFVAGDVNNLHPLLHEASDDGRIAGGNAARHPDGIRAAKRRTPLSIVFSDPQIAIVGQSYADVGSCSAMAGEVDYGDQGRARVQGMNAGIVRIYAEQHTGRLIGAELFGPRVEHTAHLLAWAVQQGMTVEQALGMPFYHPVVEEGIRTALRNLSASLRHGEPIKCAVSEMGVGS